MRRGALWLTATGLTLGGFSGAAPANVPTEEQRAAVAIEKTLQRHGAEVHRCFERALADRLDVAGKVELEVEVGEGGKVANAKTVSEDPSARPLSSCLVASAGGWQVDGIEVGASLVLPFDFAGQMNQFVVKSADVPERGPGASRIKEPGKDGRPVPPPPFTTRVLANPVNVRAQNASLTLLSVSPANRVAMHRHPHTAEALYLLKGHARLLGPPGSEPEKIDEGTAVFIPAGYPHVIENMGRQTTAVFLEVFAAAGPEKVYRDPKDAQARAEFEVIRDPSKAKAATGNGQLVVKSLSDVKSLPAFGGKAAARILLEPQDTGSQALALDLIEFAPGLEVPRHQHPGSEELLYVTVGGGTLTVGSESYPFAAEDVIHIPADQPHGAKFGREDKTIAIQIYAPAGPEQRFRGAEAAKK